MTNEQEVLSQKVKIDHLIELLLSSKPEFELPHQCNDEENFLEKFSDHFTSVNNGYMNSNLLIKDTLLYLTENKFDSKLDLKEESLVIRIGQMKSNSLEGVGRKIKLKFEVSIDEHDNKFINSFDARYCQIYEG